MESNKVEAAHAKSIAEGKLKQNDYASAKKFALKAQSLCPELVGISQLLTILQVYVSAQPKLNGETNWYKVLGVDPYADDQTIKKQYRKLALEVHPDKNNCIGANDAFKLISEAWCILSDKANKLEYDYRLGYKQRPIHPLVMPHWLINVPTAPSAPPHTTAAPSNGTANVSNKPARDPLTLSRKRGRGPIMPTTKTFWTACCHCNTKFEHGLIFRDVTIFCNVCQKPFMASETVPPFEFKRTQHLFLRRRGSVSAACYK